MKILQVMAGARFGGAETAFADTCLALHEAGQIIEIVTRPDNINIPRLEQAGIRVHALPFGGAPDIYTPWRMRGIIKNFQPDIVQTWMSRACAKTPRWKKSAGVPRYAVVARLGGYYNLKYFRAADYFVTITPDIKRYLEEQGVKAETIRHINNFAETEDSAEPARRGDLETPGDAKLLLALGRLHPAKGFDTLIRAVADLPGVYLWIAGEGPQRAELERLIHGLSVQDRVRLPGWRSDRAALFQACDICVFSSRYEPFGTVFVQAWAQKTPLITTSADGPRQFVRHGEDGLVVPVDDAAALREAIKLLIQNRELQEKLVKNGFDRYQGEFTKARTVQDYLGFYNEIRGNMRL